jgi:23S rRNA (guanosine2251-2'-O)-methyltransferase
MRKPRQSQKSKSSSSSKKFGPPPRISQVRAAAQREASLTRANQGHSGSSKSQAEKHTYPKSWRQVAGTHAIMELLRVHPSSVQTVLVQSNWRSSGDLRELMDLVQSKKIKIEEKSDQQLQEISRSHQGAVAFSNLNLEFDFSPLAEKQKSLVLALDGVEDTQNLGAILRTSWLMGVDGLIIPEDRAVGLTATVHKVACGGAEHVPLHRANQFADPFGELKEMGYWVFGLSHKAKKSIYELEIPEKVIWVLGAEDKGLRSPTEKACDELVSIPQSSPQASYNVSVSAALALAETKRQWMKKK